MGVQEAVVHVPREGRQGGQPPKQKSRRKRKEDVHGSNEYAEEVLLIPHELGLGVNDARGLYGRPCDCPSSLRKPRRCALTLCRWIRFEFHGIFLFSCFLLGGGAVRTTERRPPLCRPL